MQPQRLLVHIQHAFSRARFHLRGLKRRNAISQRPSRNYLFEERTRRKRIITPLSDSTRSILSRYSPHSFYPYFIVIARAKYGFINVRLQNLSLVERIILFRATSSRRFMSERATECLSHFKKLLYAVLTRLHEVCAAL